MQKSEPYWYGVARWGTANGLWFVYLRELKDVKALEFLGTHVGCEHGVCGACTILIDGRSARSCLTLAVQVEGCDITTIEGLANADGSLSILQQALSEKHGLQCGFCTPGMLTTLSEFLRDHPAPSEQQVREAISGNLCRCTGYQGIVEAALLAASRIAADRP